LSPRKVKEGYVTKTIRFVALLNIGMETLAERTGHSQTDLFNEAVKEYLERQAERNV